MRCATLFQGACGVVQKGLGQQIFLSRPNCGHGSRGAGRKEGHVGQAHLGEDPAELIFGYVGKCPRHKKRGHIAVGWKGGEGYQRG